MPNSPRYQRGGLLESLMWMTLGAALLMAGWHWYYRMSMQTISDAAAEAARAFADHGKALGLPGPLEAGQAGINRSGRTLPVDERAFKREMAWQRFYTPSPPCSEDASSAACRTEYAEARQRFERLWSAGRL
jgi:hypothetical protein